MYSLHRVICVLAAGLLVAAAFQCGIATSGQQGISCTQNSDCASGLLCLSETVAVGDGGCTPAANICMTTCTTTLECTSALGGPYYACTVADPCGASVRACQPLPVPVDGGALDASSPDASGD